MRRLPLGLATTFLAILLAILFVFRAPPASADDDAAGDSAAAQAFREGFWAETGEHALDRALERYRAAAKAEGPDAVRAKALYREGVVLERLGKTEDAIHALERLTKEYPGEMELLQEARAKLDAWTATDIRSSFDEWYHRYQYGPEFQAKVVDLVLKLGLQSPNVNNVPEEKELLTIGEAAIPALRRQLDSSNDDLRAWATAVLLELGEVPPAKPIATTSIWPYRRQAWTTLLELPDERRAKLVEDLRAEGDKGAMLAKLWAETGSVGDRGLVLLRDPEARGWAEALARVLLTRPGGLPTEAALVGAVGDPELNGAARMTLLRALLDRDRVPAKTWLGWLGDGPADVRGELLRRLANGALRSGEAWRVLLTIPPNANWRFGGGGTSSMTEILTALFRSIAAAPSDADLTPAAVRLASWFDENGGVLQSLVSLSVRDLPNEAGAGCRRILPLVIEAAPPGSGGFYAALGAYRFAMTTGGDTSEAVGRLLGWTKTFPDDARREAVGERAASLATTGDELDRLLEAMSSVPVPVGVKMVGGLDASVKRLPWTRERVAKLLGLGTRLEGHGAFSKLLSVFLQDRDRLELALDASLAEPSVVWERTFEDVTLTDEPMGAALRQGVERAWPTWSEAQRLAALRLFGGLLASPADAPFATFLREALAEARGEVAVALVRLILGRTLDDVRKAVDLADPAEAAEVAAWRWLPPTLASYEALSAFRRLADDRARSGVWNGWIDNSRTPDPAVRHRAARDMLEDPAASVRAQGIGVLRAFRDPGDVPAITNALADEAPVVRSAAAYALGDDYDPAAIRALAGRLDDPDPNVRDAVLKTLEAIKEVEEQKAYWRAFAEGKR